MSHKPQDARLKCNTSRSISYKSQEARFKLAYVASVSVRFRSKERPRLQNSPYFCVFKYTRAVKQKVWNEAENRERDLARDVSHVRLLRHALPISWLISRKKTDCFAVYDESWSFAQSLRIIFILLSGRILTLFLTKRGCIFKAERVRLPLALE